MKKLLWAGVLAGLLLCGGWSAAKHPPAAWRGVDETVVEKYAAQAGRPARPPFINTDQGDLLLFAFLIAGISGGFVAGYYFHALFPPRREGVDERRNV